MSLSTSKKSSRQQGPQGPKAQIGRKKRLYNVVQAKFRTSFIKYDLDARELQLSPGDQVIVQTDRGPLIAQVTGQIQRQLLEAGSIAQVARKATDADVAQADRNESRERHAYKFCIERIRARNLAMKLIRAQYMQDGSKIVFYFSADGRIDFRDLVKDLAHQYRTRIEMHQVGVRDGARMLGGVGPCGRELCCSSFLDNFDPVSIRMAKQQGLTLNPTKVSGMCGRLMCCLVYEQQIYRRMKKALPRAGQTVQTELGTGEILDVDIINRRVNVRLADQNRHNFAVAQVEVIDAHTLQETVDGAQRPVEYYRFGQEKPVRTPVELIDLGDLVADGGQSTPRTKPGRASDRDHAAGRVDEHGKTGEKSRPSRGRSRRRRSSRRSKK